MKQSMAIEIISFGIQPNYTRDEIDNGLRILDKFYTGQSGYNGMRIIFDKDESIMLVIDWSDIESERKASQLMMSSNETVDFKKLVNPHTVNKKLYNSYIL